MGDFRVQSFDTRRPEWETTWHGQDGHHQIDTKDHSQYSMATLGTSSPEVNPSRSTVFKQ